MVTDGADSPGCTLCDLPLTETAVTGDAGEAFCCRGCRQVHETVSAREDLTVSEAAEDVEAALGTEPTDIPEDHETTFLRIHGMHCATCEAFIESTATGNEHVSAVDASYITDTVRIAHDGAAVDEADLIEDLTGMGYRAYARDDPKGERQATDDLMYRLVVGVLFGMMVMLNYVAIIYPTYFNGLYYPPETAAFLAEMLASPSAAYFYLVMGVLTSIVLFYTGGPILKGALVSIRTRQPNMDLLVALAATSAWAYSTLAIFVGDPHIYYDVTVGIILVVTGGSYYENQIKRRATDRLADLTEAQVEEARLYSDDGITESVSVDSLEGRETILVREGERLPVDGTVGSGEGTVDEAIITGESLPVPKREGDTVVGGSLLVEGSLVVTVDSAAESGIHRITDVVWNLQSANHGIQQLADRLATIFVPLVLVTAFGVGSLYLLTGAGVSATLLVALTVLIVSCPCALGLATPLAIASSVREALERGIVVFDETIFERLRDVEVVIFDKTGTLTTGEMRVLDATGPVDLFERAALLETHSSHPIAEAIAREFGESSQVETDGGLTEESAVPDHDNPVANPESETESAARVRDFESYTMGVGGTVDGIPILVGHPDCFAEQDWELPEKIQDRADSARERGVIPVVVGSEGSAVGIVLVGDQPREGWEAALERLAERDIEVAILTGDDERAAGDFADHPSIDHVFAGVPPEAKAETVHQFGAGRQTVMVGDGTNDAPALARADLGIALGSGTALAADAADVAIVTDDLASLETVFELSHAANSRVKQNIGWAFLYNAIAIPLAIAGLINPLFAAVAMAASSSLVVTNSSRRLL